MIRFYLIFLGGFAIFAPLHVEAEENISHYEVFENTADEDSVYNQVSAFRFNDDVEILDLNGDVENITGFEFFNQTNRPLVLNPNVTFEEIILRPNKGFLDWLTGLLGGGISNLMGSHDERKCGSCTCGLTYEKSRIVGGVVTKINQYPWMVALKYNNRFFCGGTLINTRYILTAGHCTVGLSKERLQAVFLEHDRTDSFDTKTFSRSIARVVRHGSYGIGGTYNNDIALLQLTQEVPFVDNVRPACLPTIGKSYTGSNGIVIGWGATAEHASLSSKLREINVPILSNNQCKRTPYGGMITENMLCAGNVAQGGKDACQGDSGGPLLVVNGSRHEVAGVVSWGEGCAEKNYPGVYTRVNRYITWIKGNTHDGCYC